MKTLICKFNKYYGNLKLQTKFTSALLIGVTVPVLMMAIFFYGRLYNMVVSDTLRQEQDTSAKTAPLIEEKVQKLIDTSHTLRSHDFYSSLFGISSEHSFADVAASQSAKEFQETVKTTLMDEDFKAFRVYIDLPREDCELFSSEYTKDYFYPASVIKGTYWYGIFQGNHSADLFCPPFYLGEKEQQQCGNIAYLHSTVLSYHSTPVKLYVAVYSSSESLTGILKENLSLPGSVSYIVNDRDNQVASSDESISGIYWLSYDTIQESFMSSNNFIERTILEQKIYAGFYSITNAGWFMVTILPSGPLVAQSNKIMLQLGLMFIAFLILAVFFASTLSNSITNRISSVILQMNKVRQGVPKPMENPVAHDEIGDLIDTYNFMTQKMSQLMDEQATAAEDLRIAEFNSLQAQINPHFLYNTMDMINWLAQQGRTTEISDAVQNLSRFYKLTLSRRQSISTIAQEVEHITIYARLQNMRFHDSIELITDIPDELNEYQIPKLTLQPVVENAILHGIMEKDTKVGTIVLTSWMEGSDILLLISDDGIGIPSEKLPALLTGTGQSTSGGTNIAVYNTHRRLQILYGENYGLSYNSAAGKGTEVLIRIPAIHTD